MNYDPTVFDVDSVEAAKAIILTPEDGSTEARWADETNWLVGRILQRTKPGMVILDFGCGIGRLAKPLVHWGNTVLGVDPSEKMRALAEDYVGNAAFMAVDPARLRATIDTGWRPDFIITVWVLQHSAALIEDIDLLRRCRAPLFVVNNHRRAVPVDGGMWADDGQDIRNELWKRFTEVDYGDIPSGLGAERLVGNAFWGLYA